jgi:hypothetical protein
VVPVCNNEGEQPGKQGRGPGSSASLDLKPGASRAEVLAAMDGHVLAEGWLMGTYRRTK